MRRTLVLFIFTQQVNMAFYLNQLLLHEETLIVVYFCSFIIIAVFLMFGDMEKLVEVNLHSTQSLFTYALLSFFFLNCRYHTSGSFQPRDDPERRSVGFCCWCCPVTGVRSFVELYRFYLGRKSNPLINKFFSPKDREISDRLFHKFGNVAITISKALPIISEAVSVVSGTTAITFKTFSTIPLPAILLYR